MEEKLREMAERFLDDVGQFDVEDLIEEGRVNKAKAYVFGSIEQAWNNGEISDVEYKKIVDELQIPEELKEGLASNRARHITRSE